MKWIASFMLVSSIAIAACNSGTGSTSGTDSTSMDSTSAGSTAGFKLGRTNVDVSFVHFC